MITRWMIHHQQQGPNLSQPIMVRRVCESLHWRIPRRIQLRLPLAWYSPQLMLCPTLFLPSFARHLIILLMANQNQVLNMPRRCQLSPQYQQKQCPVPFLLCPLFLLVQQTLNLRKASIPPTAQSVLSWKTSAKHGQPSIWWGRAATYPLSEPGTVEVCRRWRCTT